MYVKRKRFEILSASSILSYLWVCKYLIKIWYCIFFKKKFLWWYTNI